MIDQMDNILVRPEPDVEINTTTLVHTHIPAVQTVSPEDPCSAPSFLREVSEV